MLEGRTEKKIGQILIDEKLITKRQLMNALERQKEKGQYLGKNLIDLGYIDEDELTKFIAEQYKIPYISLDRYRIKDDEFNILPEDLCQTYGILPIDLIGGILTVAMVDAPDEATVKRLKELTGFKIQVMMIAAGDFNRYIKKVHSLSIVHNDRGFGQIEPHRRIFPPSYRGEERRRYPRFSAELKVKYEYRDEYNINSSLNVSLGGLLVKSKTPIPVNTHIILRLELPTTYEDIIIMARAVRVERIENPDIYRIAFCFSRIDSRGHNKLSEFLKSLKI